MSIRRYPQIKSSEITDRKLYLNRRQFLAAAGVATGMALAGSAFCAGSDLSVPNS